MVLQCGNLIKRLKIGFQIFVVNILQLWYSSIEVLIFNFTFRSIGVFHGDRIWELHQFAKRELFSKPRQFVLETSKVSKH